MDYLPYAVSEKSELGLGDSSEACLSAWRLAVQSIATGRATGIHPHDDLKHVLQRTSFSSSTTALEHGFAICRRRITDQRGSMSPSVENSTVSLMLTVLEPEEGKNKYVQKQQTCGRAPSDITGSTALRAAIWASETNARHRTQSNEASIGFRAKCTNKSLNNVQQGLPRCSRNTIMVLLGPRRTKRNNNFRRTDGKPTLQSTT